MLQTAALIFVSDLFLQGKKENKTLARLISELNLLNYQVEKVSIVHENEKIVTYELDILSKHFDIVIVIGELNKDIVFKALSNVTFQDLETNLKFERMLNNIKYSSNCRLPIATKLLAVNDDTYPIIQFQRIFILKEEYLEKFFNTLRRHLEQYRLPAKYTKTIHVQMNGNTSQILDKIKKSNVNVLCQENHTVLAVMLESTNFADITDCENLMKKELRDNFIESFIENKIFDMIYANPEERIQQAIENIETCLANYSPENVFLSFNGGKDCTILLHLVHTVMNIKYPHYKRPIFCLYVKSENAFPEQDTFISQCEVYFNLEVMTVSLGIKEALNEVLLRKPNLKACLMGTRRTDPFSNDLKIFQMTDSDWPQVMRVSPLLDWHYSDIWDYILYYKVPYCKLYDLGFTSLGNTLNTIRNPCLIYHDVFLGTDVYLPAYKMLNENKERSGRNILNKI
ncbi:hypothetical protein NQ314_003969 [Rhamnusium bicolor]|uniref:FAD synthase n=1 Tax=Rhamnusium bicolor TaxID=1586634 RepID=A0AAV8ZMD9_9CUCU|nr:hypothetical protein NQ314_003969 [Rhamnusium bicolor]